MKGAKPPPPTHCTGPAIVAAAESQKGIPYVFGGGGCNGKSKGGYDCSGTFLKSHPIIQSLSLNLVDFQVSRNIPFAQPATSLSRVPHRPNITPVSASISPAPKPKLVTCFSGPRMATARIAWPTLAFSSAKASWSTRPTLERRFGSKPSGRVRAVSQFARMQFGEFFESLL